MKIGSLFSGYGGLERGVQEVLGGTVAWHSEIDPGACKILAHRYPDVPNLGDITAVDWANVEPVDVLTGGSPCQDVSAAGKRLGMRAGTRSGLWASMCDAIEIIRPGLVVWENVRGALSAHADSAMEPCPICVGDERDAHLRALGRVVGDLSELGYVGRWVGLRAADVGAPHGRFRVFVVAWPAGDAPGDDARPVKRGRRAADWEAKAHTRPGGDARGVRPEPGGSGPAFAHSADDGRERGWLARVGRDGSADHGDAVADASRVSDQNEPLCGNTAGQHERPVSGPGARDREGRPPAGVHDVGRAAAELAWGPYESAIRRWERVLGQPAPAPTELGAKGNARLAPVFVEWMMGLPAGWVTDVPGLSRNEQLKALGNGVCPPQAAQALRMLLPDVARAAA